MKAVLGCFSSLGRYRNWLFVAGILIALESSARAGLDPGQVEYNPALNPPFAFFSPSYVTGPLPADFNHLIVSSNFPYNYDGHQDGSFFGFVRSSVWANSAGQLAFSYAFNNLNPSPGSPLTEIVRATINDPSNPWAGFHIFAAGADSSGNSTSINGFFGGWSNGDPFSVERDGSDSGISFNLNPLNSGTQLNSTTNDTSALIWVTTDARSFRMTNVGLSDNGHVGVAEAFAPNTPEPATLLLAVVGGVEIAIRGATRRCPG
jgi:hypothetical protein